MDRILLEDGSGGYLLEDGSGVIAPEWAVASVPVVAGGRLMPRRLPVRPTIDVTSDDEDVLLMLFAA